MNKWNIRFIELAEIIGKWSKDPSRKIGAVIVDSDNRIVSTGFNGFARNIKDDQNRLKDKDIKRTLMLHAEENAILYAKQNLNNCSIYIAGLPPCVHCSSMIIQSGIKFVYYKNTKKEKPSDFWKDNLLLASKILEEANVKLIEIN